MKHIEWGYLIICYLFLGGLSAGLFFVSALSTFLQKDGTPTHARIAKWGALLSPWPVIIGSGLLVFDLGNWYRFYKLFLHFQYVSPMSVGAWLLMLFSLITLVYAFAWLTAAERDALFARVPNKLRLLHVLNVDLTSYRRSLGAVGLPIAIGVGIYTGVLLGAVQSRPFWNTNLVAQLFLFSALSTGCAALLLVLAVSRGAIETSEVRLLYGLDICFLALEFFVVIPYLIHGELSSRAVQDSLRLILGGPFTLVFWAFFLGVGLLLPLLIEVAELAPPMLAKSSLHVRRPLLAAAAVLILAGGFLLRCIFVFAGQMSKFE